MFKKASFNLAMLLSITYNYNKKEGQENEWISSHIPVRFLFIHILKSKIQNSEPQFFLLLKIKGLHVLQ